ncbi:MAG: NAD-dependent epimerase/dehydratase family protein [Chloroflexota bacterium]|jgi:dihydroflavonol-4-reductase
MVGIKALVTGGTGFLGANLVAGLNKEGIRPVVIRRASSSMLALEGLIYEPVMGDVLDPPEKLAELMAGVDWVFHVAAVSDYWRQDSDWLYQVNVGGTRNVLAAAQLAAVKRLVYTSSVSALGIPVGDEVLTEESQFNLEPQAWPYAHSKHLAEIEVRRACQAGLEGVIVQPSVCIGPRDLNLISGSIIVEAARGLARIYPPGGSNYVAVEEVVAGHIAAAQRGKVGERYILGGENLSHRRAMEIVCEIVGRPAPKIGLPSWSIGPLALAVRGARAVFGNRIPFNEWHVRLSGKNVYFEPDKAVRELGLRIVPFRRAVKNAYDWYNEHDFLS